MMSNVGTTISGITCPECGDQLPARFNFCPRCFVPLSSDPGSTEAISEIDDPPGIDCYILKPGQSVVFVLARPDICSRRLFLMTPKDLLPIVGEEGQFFCVRTPGGKRGYVGQAVGLKVRVGAADVDASKALGYFRVNEQLIKWKSPYLPFTIDHAPLKLGPNLNEVEIARIKSDVALPVVGETFGWLMVQLPQTRFRAWTPEAYGYRMLRADSFGEVTKPLSSGEVLAGIAGVVAVVTLAGAGAALDSMLKDS